MLNSILVYFSRLESLPLDIWHDDIAIGLTRYLATYWADKNVRCNAMCPGGVENGQPDDFLEDVNKRIPMGRMANVYQFIIRKLLRLNV